MKALTLLLALLCPGLAFADTTLVTSVWPEFRAGQIDTTTPFLAAVTNVGQTTAKGVGVTLEGTRPAIQFFYQTLNATGTAFTSAPNTPTNIPPGETRYFFLGITGTEVIPFPLIIQPIDDLTFVFQGTNAALTSNTVRFTVTLVGLAQELLILPALCRSDDGIVAVNLPGQDGEAAFSFSMQNTWQYPGDFAGYLLVNSAAPVDLLICRTNQQGTCLAAPVKAKWEGPGPVYGFYFSLALGETQTFAVFARGTGQRIALDPQENRINIRAGFFSTISNATYGVASIPIRTHSPACETSNALSRLFRPFR